MIEVICTERPEPLISAYAVEESSIRITRGEELRYAVVETVKLINGTWDVQVLAETDYLTIARYIKEGRRASIERAREDRHNYM